MAAPSGSAQPPSPESEWGTRFSKTAASLGIAANTRLERMPAGAKRRCEEKHKEEENATAARVVQLARAAAAQGQLCVDWRYHAKPRKRRAKEEAPQFCQLGFVALLKEWMAVRGLNALLRLDLAGRRCVDDGIEWLRFELVAN